MTQPDNDAIDALDRREKDEEGRRAAEEARQSDGADRDFDLVQGRRQSGDTTLPLDAETPR